MSTDRDTAGREAIRALHRRDERAAKDQDFRVLRSLLDDDAVVMEPGKLPLRGRVELDRSFETRSEQKPEVAIEEYRFEWEEIEIFDERAIEWGRILGRVRDLKSGQVQDLAYNVMRVLKREAGTWRIYRTIWNESESPKRRKSTAEA